MHIAFLVFYVLLITAIGIFSMKKVKGISEFFLGGRSINPWMSAFSYGTAYFSAVLFIGYAGKIGWGFGISSLWIVVGNTIVGSYLAWRVLGKRTREMTHRLDVSTMPEFIGVRYKSKSLKIVTATIIFIFLIPYSASVYKGLGYLFEEIFGLPTLAVLLIMAGFTALYLFLGGFVASTIADFIQGLIMIAGVVMMLFFIISHPTVGGFQKAYHTLGSIDAKLLNPVGPNGWIPIVSLVVLTSLGSWGLPQMVHKFYTIKNEKSITCAKWVSTAFALLITFGAYFTGVLSRLFFPKSMPEVNGIPNPDIVIPQLLSKTLPDMMLGIILILVLSASMSTLASLVLASSSAIALDLIKGVFLPNIDKGRLTVLMKVLCIIFVVFSFILAVLPNPIMTMAALSWGAVSGSLLAPYLLGLYWKKVTRTGVWAGIITALSIVVGGAVLTGMKDSLIPVFGALAIVVPLLVVPLVSLATKEFESEHINNIYNTAKSNVMLPKEGVLADDMI